MVRQFVDVVSSYDLVGIKIHGIVSDSGGGNAKFFHIISEYTLLKGKWMSNTCVCAVNLIDPNRCMYI